MKLKVLILTSTIGINKVILPFVLPRAQISALKGIAYIPGELRDKIQILIRPRPGNQDLRMYKNLGLGDMLIPSETSLEENIINSDLIVTLNNYQTSLSHAIRLDKPIIMFTNDKSLLKWGMMSYSEKYIELGTTISEIGEFWSTLKRIQMDNKILEEMQIRTKEFYNKYWNTTECPTIVDAILEEIDN
jgi:hypothetical protein